MTITLRETQSLSAFFVRQGFAEQREMDDLIEHLSELAQSWLCESYGPTVEILNDLGDYWFVRWVSKEYYEANGKRKPSLFTLGDAKKLANNTRRWQVRKSLGIEIPRDAYDVLLLLIPWDELDQMDKVQILKGISGVLDMVYREDISPHHFLEKLRKSLGLHQLVAR